MKKRTELAWRLQRDTRRPSKGHDFYINIKSVASSAAVVAAMRDLDLHAFIEEMTRVRHSVIRSLAMETGGVRMPYILGKPASTQADNLKPEDHQPSQLETVTQTLDPENTRAALKALVTLANDHCDAGQARIQFYSVDVDDTNIGPAGPVDTPFEGWLTDYFGHYLECRKCGCTETRPCVNEHGPCSWVEVDLCSLCAETDNQQPNELEP